MLLTVQNSPMASTACRAESTLLQDIPPEDLGHPPFLPLSKPLCFSFTVFYRHALSRRSKYVPTPDSQLCRRLCPESSVFPSLGKAVPCHGPVGSSEKPHSLHGPCSVSHCWICLRTFSILIPSLYCSLCCSSAPLECRLGNCPVTGCLEGCREQVFQMWLLWMTEWKLQKPIVL